MVFENFSASDTNHVIAQKETNGAIQTVIKLQYIPIPGSIQGTVISGGLPQSIGNPVKTYKNVIFHGLHRYDLNNTSYSFQYVRDTRQTNLVQIVELRENHFFIDAQLVLGAFLNQ